MGILRSKIIKSNISWYRSCNDKSELAKVLDTISKASWPFIAVVISNSCCAKMTCKMYSYICSSLAMSTFNFLSPNVSSLFIDTSGLWTVSPRLMARPWLDSVPDMMLDSSDCSGGSSSATFSSSSISLNRLRRAKLFDSDLRF